jgi:hypothetical protein
VLRTSNNREKDISLNDCIISSCTKLCYRLIIVIYAYPNIPLREHLRQTPLFDNQGFTHALETAYRTIWEAHCKI